MTEIIDNKMFNILRGFDNFIGFIEMSIIALLGVIRFLC